jgi:hypothetical protein
MKTVRNNADGTQTVVALEEGALVTGTVQDCTAIAERAQALHNSGYQGPSGDMKLAASVPFVFVEKYLNDNRITMQDLMRDKAHQRRFLGDPALAHFRVWKGRV